MQNFISSSKSFNEAMNSSFKVLKKRERRVSAFSLSHALSLTFSHSLTHFLTLSRSISHFLTHFLRVSFEVSLQLFLRKLALKVIWGLTTIVS